MDNIIDNKNKEFRKFFSLIPALLLAISMVLGSTSLNYSHAATAASATTDEQDCTVKSDGTPNEEYEPYAKGLITDVVNKIKSKLVGTTIAGVAVPGAEGMAPKLFKAIRNDSGFLGALRAAMTLYIAIYGILFMAGIVEIKLQDFIITLFKFAIAGALLSDTSWSYFSNTVIKFFNDGTDHIINEATKIAVGGGTPIVGISGAFGALDSALSKALSPKMVITMLASFPTTVYGFLFAAMLGISILLFIQAIIHATWIYVMSLAMKALLFGLAPLFIPCILFQRTKHLFDGWLNQIIAFSILPILLFVFLSFFVTLMDAAMMNVLSDKEGVCWSSLPEGVRGSPLEYFYWRFMERNSAGELVPKVGSDKLDDNINIVAILTFLILAYIAKSFNTIVTQIANQLASTASSLAGSNPVSEVIGKFMGGKRG